MYVVHGHNQAAMTYFSEYALDHPAFVANVLNGVYKHGDMYVVQVSLVIDKKFNNLVEKYFDKEEGSLTDTVFMNKEFEKKFKYLKSEDFPEDEMMTLKMDFFIPQSSQLASGLIEFFNEVDEAF